MTSSCWNLIRTWVILFENNVRRTWLLGGRIRKLLEGGELYRYSLDKISNTHGKELINLCKATGLPILNGRKGDDKKESVFESCDSQI